MKKYLKKEWKDFIKSWNNLVNKNKVFSILPHNLLLFCIFILSIFLGLSIIINHSNKVLYMNDSHSKVYDPLLVYEQKYSFKDVEVGRKVTNVCLKFATYLRENKASYEFRVYSGEKLYQSVVFTADLVKENEFKCFKTNIPNIKDYDIAIRPLYADSDNVISLYGNEKNISIKLENNYNIYTSYTLLLIIYILTVLSVCYIINRK